MPSTRTSPSTRNAWPLTRPAFEKELQLPRNDRGDRAVDQALRQIRQEELRQAVEARTGMQAPARAPSP
jgi:hypothetical protein